MADNVAITAGAGTTVAADEVVDGTLGTVKVQYVKLMDGTLDGTTKATVGAGGVKTDPTSAVAMNTGTRSATTQRVTVATDDVVPASQSGTWTVQPGNTANTTPWLAKVHDGTNASTVKAASTAAVAADTALVVAVSPNNYDFGSGTGGTKTQRMIVDSSQLGTLGQTTMSASAPVTIPTDQTWKTGMSNRSFTAAFTTLTRPANTTAYTAADSISDNATAGSVTALSATISDTNDDPIFISDILVTSTDTGLAGKKIRAYLFNSDPTASTGVGAGDNAAYSQKKAGYIGSFMGWMETGFSDGTVGRLVPCFNETNNTQAGGFIVCKPTSAAKTLFIQYQAVEAFTPSANSTTIIGSARGWQGRAA
jgi:hypothetical protein